MDEVNAVIAAEEFLRSLADIRAEVHRINEVYIRICFAQLGNGAADVLHRLAVVLAAVRGNEDNAVVLKVQRFELLIAELEIRLYGHVDRINNRVAHDKHAVCDTFLCKIITVARSRRKVQRCNLTGQLAVHFLRERAVLIVGTQTGLYMADRHLVVECRKRTGKGGRGITVDEHDVRLCLFEHLIQTVQALLGDGRQRLTRLHDVQVIIRLNIENIEHLIEHLTVLRGNTHNGFSVFILLERVHQRRHLNGLRAGAENRHYLDFIHRLYPPCFRMRVCSSVPHRK